MRAGLHVVHVSAEVAHGADSGVQVGALPGVHQDELDRQAKALLEAETERILGPRGARLRGST